MADHAVLVLALEVVEVGLARRHGGNARAGEGNLGGGAELVHQVGVAGGAGQLKDVGDGGGTLGVEEVLAVGVVPVHAEVGCGGLQARDALDDLVGIDAARGIGVLGDAPHALDVGVGHEGLDGVHVRAVLTQRHADALEAELRDDAEVAVVAGNEADPLELAGLHLQKHRVGAADALDHGVADGVVHEGERALAAEEDVLGGHAQDVTEELAARRDALQAAVVCAVDAAVCENGVGLQDIEHGTRQVELLGGRLAARHVELQAARLDLGNALLEFGSLACKLGVGEGLIV